jgi:chromosomal replication initiation ATPase DnaA
VSGVPEEDLKRSRLREEVQRAREIVCYLSRRYGDVGLGELARFLGVKELSTPSHAVGRAEKRLQEDASFRRQLERTLKIVTDSFMQA